MDVSYIVFAQRESVQKTLVGRLGIDLIHFRPLLLCLLCKRKQEIDDYQPLDKDVTLECQVA